MKQFIIVLLWWILIQTPHFNMYVGAFDNIIDCNTARHLLIDQNQTITEDNSSCVERDIQ